METNEEILERYRMDLELESKKQITIKNKVFAIIVFHHFLNKPFLEATDIDVQKYFLAIKHSKKPNTAHRYITELKMFYSWLIPDNTFFKKIKSKRSKKYLPAEAMITPEEAMKILAQARCQRDRALIFLMWDSAARLGELLNMRKKDVTFDQDGGTITVFGKTGERIVRIVDSIPDLQLWFRHHQGNLNDYLFCLPNGKQLTSHGAQNIVGRAAKRAGVEKNIHPHLFRHSKITALTRMGMTEMELRIYAGWSGDSQMPATYIHLSGRDVQDKILDLAGVSREKKVELMNTKTKMCPRCYMKNSFDAIHCSQCSMILDQTKARDPMGEKMNEMQEKIDKLEKMYNLSQFFEMPED